MRTCHTCGVEKSEDDFHVRSNGYTVWQCKVCSMNAAEVWRLQNLDRHAASSARYRERNRLKVSQSEMLYKQRRRLERLLEQAEEAYA